MRVRVVVLRVLLRRWVVSAGLDHDTSVMENGRVEIKKEDGPVHRYVIAHRRRGRRSLRSWRSRTRAEDGMGEEGGRWRLDRSVGQ